MTLKELIARCKKLEEASIDRFISLNIGNHVICLWHDGQFFLYPRDSRKESLKGHLNHPGDVGNLIGEINRCNSKN